MKRFFTLSVVLFTCVIGFSQSSQEPKDPSEPAMGLFRLGITEVAESPIAANFGVTYVFAKETTVITDFTATLGWHPNEVPFSVSAGAGFIIQMIPEIDFSGTLVANVAFIPFESFAFEVTGFYGPEHTVLVVGLTYLLGQGGYGCGYW